MSEKKHNRSVQLPDTPPHESLHIVDEDVGLTDDQRVSREDSDSQIGARVTPGPADKERQTKQ
jgi:hypothetical protein